MKDGIYVSVLWGSCPIHPPMVYSFDTWEEKEAFLYGVYEAAGWMEAEHLEHDEPRTYSPKDFDLSEDFLNSTEERFLADWKEYEKSEVKIENPGL